MSVVSRHCIHRNLLQQPWRQAGMGKILLNEAGAKKKKKKPAGALDLTSTDNKTGKDFILSIIYRYINTENTTV